MKPRLGVLAGEFPTLSQTYVKWELEQLRSTFDIKVISSLEADVKYRDYLPYEVISDPEAILSTLKDFRPDLLHTHYVTTCGLIHFLAHKLGVPFTLRAHSFDTFYTFRTDKKITDPDRIARRRQSREEARVAINSSECLGILAFPFARSLMEDAGIDGFKIKDCFPVVNYAHFHDESPNGEGVMNTGACLPKKKMEDFLYLGARVPVKTFTLYPIGDINSVSGHATSSEVRKLLDLNHALGSPVHIHPPTDPSLMPREYKKHDWLVYTADPEMNTVGWPMAVAEAQAAGVGVCMPNLRPDLRDYVGDAGYLYNSLDDVRDIITRPFPDERRREGFRLAKRSDIADHIQALTSLWEPIVSSTVGR